jgi:hypothetical protein
MENPGSPEHDATLRVVTANRKSTSTSGEKRPKPGHGVSLHIREYVG